MRERERASERARGRVCEYVREEKSESESASESERVRESERVSSDGVRE